MTFHDFGEKYAQGTKAEDFLDALFSRDYRIEVADRGWQRRGIDRFFYPKSKPGSPPYRVEYKTDWQAARTHNAFIETTSVDTTGKQGWAYGSEAEILVYHVVGDDLVYILRMSTIRRLLPGWIAAYPTRPAPNRDYNTLGVCVPLAVFERFAIQVINLADVPDLPPLY